MTSIPEQQQQPQQDLQQPESKQIKNMDNISLTQAEPIELSWKNLNIIATVQDPSAPKKKCGSAPKTKKTIIQDSEGILRPGQFTAIMGPSGSGKTTLLNFLSGRLASPNLKIYGNLFINGKAIRDIEEYSGKIAYVMQDDILLATNSPRESFHFVAKMRLPHLTPHQRAEKVETLIKELGLTDCSNTKVGNELMRGISGGERKRTSIGVELLTSPSMVFLDEPTTGLDSSTAEQVVVLLKHLAKVKGVNIVSTIHQPSSEIFSNFERLLLLVRGQIIYQGDSQKALKYFDEQGFKCPAYQNPSDHFMKIMNEEGLMIEKIQKGEELPPDEKINEEFSHRLTKMINTYQKSDQIAQLDSRERHEIEKKDYNNASYFLQFIYLFARSFITEIRNPMSVKMKLIQTILFSIIVIVVFNNLGDDGYAALQNRKGALFFIITQQAFGSIQGALASFSHERPLFLRERQSNSYQTGPYYWGRSLAELPFDLIYPILSISIVYFSIGLATRESYQFPALLLAGVMTYFTGASYGFLISILVSKLEIAMTLVPVVIVPLMVLAGFFISSENIPDYLIWISYISMFRWGFQCAMINEFAGQDDFICSYIENGQEGFDEAVDKAQARGMDVTDNSSQAPYFCDPVDDLGFNETYWETLFILLGLGVFIRLVALLAMYLIANPKRPKLNSPTENQEEINMAKNQSQKLALSHKLKQ